VTGLSPTDVTDKSVTALGFAEGRGGGGGAVTVREAVPITPSLVAVIVAEPAEVPLASPFWFTMAIVESLLLWEMVLPVSALPAESRSVAVNYTDPPTEIFALIGSPGKMLTQSHHSNEATRSP